MKKIITTTLPIAGAFGLIYLLATLVIQYADLQFTNYPNWASRFALMGAATVAIIRFRLANKNIITFRQGLIAGLFASLALGAVISTHTFFLRSYIRPTYNAELREIYHGILARQSEPKWTEEQIQRQLDGPWAYFFTTQGGVVIDILGSISIGLVASLSVSYMARRVRDTSQ